MIKESLLQPLQKIFGRLKIEISACFFFVFFFVFGGMFRLDVFFHELRNLCNYSARWPTYKKYFSVHFYDGIQSVL